jgi:hypothetical protein
LSCELIWRPGLSVFAEKPISKPRRPTLHPLSYRRASPDHTVERARRAFWLIALFVAYGRLVLAPVAS